MLNGSSSYSNGNSFLDAERKAATLAPPFQWGQPIPDMRLMGQK